MTPSRRLHIGFTLAELMVAVFLVAVAMLSVFALTISVLRTDQKTRDTSVGREVAQMLAERTFARVRADQPAGTRANFWENDFVGAPYETGSYKQGSTEFKYTIYAQTVVDTLGDSVGGNVDENRLKKVDVILSWWDSDAHDRTGYGQLKVYSSHLFSEADLR